jgi:probable rRNA maturation factor
MVKVKPVKSVRPVAIRSLHNQLIFKAEQIEHVIHLLDENHEKWATKDSVLGNNDELSIAFLPALALARLHEQFLDDPSETDVITFPGDKHLKHAGDICVSPDAAYLFAKEHKKDFSEELTLYVVHGWLHLAGYDDLQPALKRAMRRAEAKALTLLRKHKAIPKFKLLRK